MKVASELTENVREFQMQWNGILPEIKDSEYKFNQYTFMVESVAYINRITVV